MKNIFLILVLIGGNLIAGDNTALQVLKIYDKNNESVAGAKVELLGTDKIYYTNSKGECYIPETIYKSCDGIKIDCISYKSTILHTNELNSKIILEFR